MTLSIAFVNPPHADWSLANNNTYLMCQSHYTRNGKYSDRVTWLPAPYKWNSYTSYQEIYEEIKDADIILFSSYAWNYTLIDDLCRHAKLKNPKVLTAIGGPHIGTNEPLLMATRNVLYDYICQPTKPGEQFVEDLVNSWFEDDYFPIHDKISWECTSSKKQNHMLDAEDYSVYEDHYEYLSELIEYANRYDMEPFIVLETTRGCPYKCVYCEWGGGIGTKIVKKNMDVVKRDIIALKNLGFRNVYLTDANFGVFEDRDVEIFEFAWKNNINLTDISTVKSKDLTRRIRLINRWFDIIGVGHAGNTAPESVWNDLEYTSVVPTISIQSISEEAMRIADRVDLSTEDKLALGRHINTKCNEHGFPVPPLELILAMPGSTITDFYNEMELIWNFKAWGSFRHDYMFLPDSRLNSPEYKVKYDIATVEVFSDIVDEGGIDNRNSLYKDKKTYFKTIRSCFSFTESEMVEMWIMNHAANYLLKNIYPGFESLINAPEFAKKCYQIMETLDNFDAIKLEVIDIFNPNTPPRSIRTLCGDFRLVTVEKFLSTNSILIKNAIMSEILINT